ncbi:hypothetical protein FYR33_22165 [Salmonella enterica]|nr:hypothetical protein [Salmonella enterica]
MDPCNGSKPKIRFLIFFQINQFVELKIITINGGGHIRGHFKGLFLFFSLFFIVLHDDLSPAFAPGAYKWTSTEVFFMPKIQKLPTFLG